MHWVLAALEVDAIRKKVYVNDNDVQQLVDFGIQMTRNGGEGKAADALWKWALQPLSVKITAGFRHLP